MATTIELEADALAASFGTVAYQEKLKLRAGLPALVLTTPDRARADALGAELRGRGHDALVCELADVVAASDMTILRRFRFEATAIVQGDVALPWNDVAALVRATHRTQTVSVEQQKEKKFNLGRALATGGLSISKTTIKEVTHRADQDEPVLYLFRRSGQPPWLLAQHRAQFFALGDRVAATAAPNFIATVTALRERAPLAYFDDRLIARKTTIAELDLLAYVLALDRGGRGPYR
jgi:hypothetical protein